MHFIIRFLLLAAGAIALLFSLMLVLPVVLILSLLSGGKVKVGKLGGRMPGQWQRTGNAGTPRRDTTPPPGTPAAEDIIDVSASEVRTENKLNEKSGQ